MKSNIWINIIIGLIFISFLAFTYSIYTDKSFYTQESVLNNFISELKNDTSSFIIENELVALKYNIEKVEEVNDKRIEVLGWSFVILSSFITIILGLNIYNYRTTIREIVKDEIDNKIKSFLLSDIKNIKFSNQKFSLDKPINEILSNVHSAWFEDGCNFKVTILVHKVVAFYFKKKKIVPTQENLKELENGDLIISFSVSHYEDIDNLIKAWLPHIEIIDPIDYKEQITTELQNYLDNTISNDFMLS